jgi:N-acetylneuraminate synthase
MENTPFIVAELSANHNNSFEVAIETVREFARRGASAIKLQTYTPETMTLNISKPEFKVDASNSLWGGRKLFDLYKEAMTPWEWHSDIFEVCKAQGVIGFSTPFDASSVDFLESIGCPIYKIASFEVVDTQLIKYVASTGKPMIISTGMATLSEIEQAVMAAKSGGCRDITLLKTTSSYPASPKDSNLLAMPVLGELFGVKFGVSDHTMGIGAALAAISLGASVVEKHVTLSRAAGGVDSSFSMEPDEFELLVREAKNVRESLGKVLFGPTPGDRSSLQFRRSLYLYTDVRAGDELSEENCRAVRPGYGMAISNFDLVSGLKFSRDFEKGTPVTMEMFK